MQSRNSHIAARLPVQTTLGDLATAFYEEALAEFGDVRVAQRVAAQMLSDTLRNRSRQS